MAKHVSPARLDAFVRVSPHGNRYRRHDGVEIYRPCDKKTWRIVEPTGFERQTRFRTFQAAVIASDRLA